MKNTQSLSASSSVSLANDARSYLLDEDLLVFSKSQQRLFHLNTVAAFIWCCFEEKIDIEKVTQLLTDTFGITKELANNDLNHILNEWQSNGLLTSHSKEATFISSEEIQKPLDYTLSSPLQSIFFSRRYYQLLDTCFEIRFADENLEEIVHPLLKHLEIAECLGENTQLDIVKNKIGNDHDCDRSYDQSCDQSYDYVLLANNTPIDYCTNIRSLTPMMHANILQLAYEETDCLLAIHAGVVSKGKQCILMPAISGNGKSTLTAALLTEGYGYCTDDLALLSRDEFQIRPVPISIGVKEGAWPVLTPWFPVIDELVTFVRMDEKVVRYLPPPPDSLHSDNQQCYSVKHIIFPKYQENATVNLTPLSTAESLCRLTEAGYDVGGFLEVLHVDDLVKWVSGIQCFALEYDSLPDAIAEIKKIF